MAKYKVYATNKVYLETIVEANSAEEAWEKVDRDWIVDDFTATDAEFQMEAKWTVGEVE